MWAPCANSEVCQVCITLELHLGGDDEIVEKRKLAILDRALSVRHRIWGFISEAVRNLKYPTLFHCFLYLTSVALSSSCLAADLQCSSSLDMAASTLDLQRRKLKGILKNGVEPFWVSSDLF